MVRSQPGQIVHETLSQKYLTQKRTDGVAEGVGHEFKPQYFENKTKQKTLCWNTFHRAETKKTCYTISHKYSPPGFWPPTRTLSKTRLL
jgi:hypothetical protein